MTYPEGKTISIKWAVEYIKQQFPGWVITKKALKELIQSEVAPADSKSFSFSYLQTQGIFSSAARGCTEYAAYRVSDLRKWG